MTEVVIKVIVTGSRDWKDEAAIEQELALLKDEHPDLLVIHGTEPGAESLVENVCSALEIATIIVTADYAEYQDLAIFKRNEVMLSVYDPHMLYCFCADIEKEPVLSEFIQKAQEKAVITKVVGVK